MLLPAGEVAKWDVSKDVIETSSASPITLLKPDINRWMFAISIDLANAYIDVRNDQFDPFAGGGIAISAGVAPQVFSYRDWADFVTREWYVMTPIFPVKISIYSASRPR